MKNAWESYGSAYLGGQLLVARVENDGARTRVTALLTADDDLNGDSLENGKLYFNAGDRYAVIKKIHIKKSSPEETAERVRFEMASSLLDTPESFYIDALPIDENGKYHRYLSIAYHRSEIDRQMKKYTDLLRQPSGFKLDAVALADGYLNFCVVEPGDLQVLINIESESVVLAVIYQKVLRAVGRLESLPGDEITPPIAARMAGELKMTISYHLAELFQEGITVPLSRIILAGRHARNQILKSALSEQVTAEITLPNIDRGYFQPATETIDRHQAERFLIPLGLALA